MTAGDPGDLDSAIDTLYRAPLDRFTAARNALASSLRKAGRRADADRVKALAKPSATAWAVNQVWWTEPAALSELLDSGAAERSAHHDRAGGRAADVRAAAGRRERAVAAVVDAAVRVLGRAGAAAGARFRIAGTVESLASSGVPPDQTAGRLTRDLQSSGLEALGALGSRAVVSGTAVPPSRPVAVPPGPSRGPAPTTHHRTDLADRRRAERLAAATQRVKSLEDTVDETAREAAGLDAALDQARAAHDQAAAQVADLERQLDDARAGVAAARRALSDATKAASEAALRRGRAAHELARARDEMTSLGDEPRRR